MNAILVWILVYATGNVYGTDTRINGDFATLEDCERVKQAAISVNQFYFIVNPGDKPKHESAPIHAQCVQVKKVK